MRRPVDLTPTHWLHVTGQPSVPCYSAKEASTRLASTRIHYRTEGYLEMEIRAGERYRFTKGTTVVEAHIDQQPPR